MKRCCAPRKPPCTRPGPWAGRDTSSTRPTCCSRRTFRKGPRSSMRKLLLALFLCLLATGTWAQESDAQARAKLAPDLLAVISGTGLPVLPWLKAVEGERMVKVLVASSSDDASLADLRSFVLS